MTPQERQLVDDLFDRLSKVESAPRDPDASNAIAQGLRNAPNAVYALVQTVLLQDEALKRADSRIQELEQARVVPRDGFPVTSSVNCHRTIGQHVARVHEQRTPIHAAPSFLDARRGSTRDVTSAQPASRGV